MIRNIMMKCFETTYNKHCRSLGNIFEDFSQDFLKFCNLKWNADTALKTEDHLHKLEKKQMAFENQIDQNKSKWCFDGDKLAKWLWERDKSEMQGPLHRDLKISTMAPLLSHHLSLIISLIISLSSSFSLCPWFEFFMKMNWEWIDC